MRNRKMVIIIIGMDDLTRCRNDRDFFRWEIDTARKLEKDKKTKVVVVIHGVPDLETLFKNSRGWGTWGEGLKKYLTDHYVVFLEVDTPGQEVDRLTKILDPTPRNLPERKKIAIEANPV